MLADNPSTPVCMSSFQSISEYFEDGIDEHQLPPPDTRLFEDVSWGRFDEFFTWLSFSLETILLYCRF